MNENNTAVEGLKEKRKKFLAGIQNLPSIPVVMLEVSRLLDNPKTSAADLGKLISKDQGLVAKILKIANSPLFGLPRKVSTVEFAIVILGFTHIKNIIIALSALETFNSRDDQYWNNKKFWMHSVVTATMAKYIAEELGYRKSGEAFIAGLLHDLGVSVVRQYFPDEYVQICEYVKEYEGGYIETEYKILGITHQEIGQFLCSKWNLPESLGETILNHHSPMHSKNYPELSAIIHLADYMTQYFQMGEFYWDEGLELDENVIEILDLGDRNYVEELVESYKDLVQTQIEAIAI